jgi:hypothetical protein
MSGSPLGRNILSQKLAVPTNVVSNKDLVHTRAITWTQTWTLQTQPGSAIVC